MSKDEETELAVRQLEEKLDAALARITILELTLKEHGLKPTVVNQLGHPLNLA